MSPPSSSPAARWRWAPTRPRMRAASPTLLPAGTPVYVNHLPRHDLAHTLPALIALREAGLEPVPHIAARRIASRAEARAFLEHAVRLARRAQGAADRRRRGRARWAPTPTAPRCCATACSPAAACSRSACRAIPRAIRASPPPRSPPRSPRSWRWRAHAGPRRLRRHAVLLRAQPHRRILRRPRPPRAGRAGLCRPRRARPARARCCAMRSAAASAPRCARCRRRAWARCGSSPTSIPPTSSPRSPATAAAGCASNVVGVHLYSFGGVAAHRAWMNARITARRG